MLFRSPTLGREWCDQASSRVSGGNVEVRVHVPTTNLSRLVSEVEDSCRDGSFAHRVLVLGVADSDAITLGMRFEAALPSAKVVTVQSVRQDEGSAESAAGKVWTSTTLQDLMSQPEVWAIDEQLGREIVGALETLAHLPGSDRELALLRSFQQLSKRDALAWATRVSARLREDLEHAGMHVAPSDDAVQPPVLMSDVLIAMSSTLQSSFEQLGSVAGGRSGMTAVLAVVQDLPEMLRRCGYSLTLGARTSAKDGLAPETVDRMAQLIHESYLRIAARLQQDSPPQSGVN